MDIEKVQIAIETSVDTSGMEKLEQTTDSARKATKEYGDEQSRANDKTNKLNKSSSSLGSTFKNLVGPLAAMVASYVSFNFAVTEALSLAKTQIETEKKLEISIQKRDQRLGLSTSQIKANADAVKDLTSRMQEQLAIGDEELNLAAERFIRVGVANDQLEKLVQLSADYAKTTGSDVPEAAAKLAESYSDLGGLTSELIRNGIVISAQDKKRIMQLQEMGQTAEGQAILFQKLEEQVGGTAERVSEDFDGALARAKNTMGDFQEELGYTWRALGNPILGDVKDLFSDLINVFKSKEAKELTVTISGIAGATKAIGQVTLGPVVKKIGEAVSELTNGISAMINGLGTISSESATAFGRVILGLQAVVDGILYLGKSWVQLGKVIAAGLFDVTNLKKEWDIYVNVAESSGAKAFNSLKAAFNSKEAEKVGKDAATKIFDEFNKYRDKTRKELERKPVIESSPQQEQQAQAVGSELGSAFSEALISEIQKGSEQASNYASGAFDFLNSFSSLVGTQTTASTQQFQDELDKLESQYSTLLDSINEQEQALADERTRREEAEQEQKQASLEAELARLTTRSDSFLTAAEKEKQKELQKQKELLASEKAAAAEEKRIAEEKAKLEQELADKKAELTLAQNIAEWENEKSRFEANKQQQIFESATAMARAPVDAALAITRAFSIDPTGILAAAVTGASLSAVATVIGNATQLASTASQTFDTPKPVKAAYTGAQIPLVDGTQFKIGGRAGAEELATVNGGMLKIDNALTTENKTQGTNNTGTQIIINGNITVQANNTQDFISSLKDVIRQERYE